MKDLLKLYSFESVHNSEDERNICDWICKWLDAHHVEGYTRHGNNIYRKTEAGDIILSAHLDQVKTNGKAVKFFMSPDEVITAYNDKWQRTSLGADDKNGIWIILKMLEMYPDSLSFIISAGEETGLIGIHALQSAGVLDKILSEKDTQCIVLDRRGNNEILDAGSSGKYCKTLAQDMCNFLDSGYTTGTGTCSDTNVLSDYCESVNMSVAYTGAHSANESTDFKALKKIKNDVACVLENFIHYNTPVSKYKTFLPTTTKKEEKKYEQGFWWNRRNF